MKRPAVIWTSLSVLAVLTCAHGVLVTTRSPITDAPGERARLWERLLAIAGRLGVPGQAFEAVIGVVSTAVILAIVYDLSTRAEGRHALRGLIAPALLALSPLVARAVFDAPDATLFAALIMVGVRRTFDETGTAGALSLSVLPWAVVLSWSVEGAALFFAMLFHRLNYARTYQQPRPYWLVITVWAVLTVVLGVILAAVTGGWSAAPIDAGGSLLAPVAELWRRTRLLVLLPFMLFFAATWKPRPIWFLAMLTALVACFLLVLIGARRPSPGPALDAMLLPLVPLVYLVAADALRALHAALAAGGFRGRQAQVSVAGFLVALGLATAWPSLELLAGGAVR